MSSRDRQGLKWLGGLVLLTWMVVQVWGYDLIRGSNGQPTSWDTGSIPMRIKLATSPALTDGTNYATSVQQAMLDWNGLLGLVQFAPEIAAPGAATSGDGVNEIVFDSTIYGEAFDTNTLAVTVSYTYVATRADGSNRFSQADIIFNTKWSWDSYRGPLAGHVPEDIRRVAIHELGHVLGLDHPDQATPPQSVTAIMNSAESNIDTMQADDIAGAQLLYGAHAVPGNDNFNSAYTITLSGNTAQVSGTNVSATSESGEPAHDPGGGAGGASVWWKWTAPSDGSLVASTAGSNFDTLLAAYTGGSVGSLTQLAANDDESSSPHIITSKITLGSITAGTTYYFAVDGWDADMGSIVLTLNFTPVINSAPGILQQPASVAVPAGQPAQFAVTAGGTGQLSYQWQVYNPVSSLWQDLTNGSVYSGVMAANLLVAGSNNQSLDGNSYRCVVTNAFGTATSDAASFVIAKVPVIVTPPQNQTVAQGTNASFTVVATSNAPVTYQWFKNNAQLSNGGNISGANGPTLTIANVQTDAEADYTVVVGNVAGSVLSPVATLALIPPVQFLSRPLSKLAVVGQPVAFSVSATGSGTLSYQWKHLGQAIAGANGATLNLASVALADRGTYEVAVTSVAGTGHSYFSLNVAIPHGAVVAWGDNQYGATVVPGGLGNVAALAAEWHNLALRTDGTVTAWGGSPYPAALVVPPGLSNVVAISAGNGFSLALKGDGTVVAWGDNYSGRATVPPDLSDVVSIATGSSFSVALKADGKVVAWGYNGEGAATVPPGLRDVIAIAAGSENALAVKSDGTVVAWGYFGGGVLNVPAGLANAIAGAVGSGLGLALKADGTVTGWAGSQAATIPAGLSGVTVIAAGQSHGLALKSDGSVVGWGFNGSGQTTVPATVTNAAGIAAGNTHSLAIIQAVAPVITTGPLDRVITVGETGSFSVAASGTAPFAYQWRRNGVDLVNGGRISGVNSATLVISPAADADNGNYSVLVGNAAGTATSASATLTVSQQPVITSIQPSKIGIIGQPATFSVAATGSGLTYVWRHNGQVIAGASGNTLTISAVTAADRGYYDVIITNPTGGHVTTRFLFKAVPAGAAVAGWGSNSFGQLNPPGAPTNVLDVSISGSHSLAVLGNGTVLGWGDNTAGQITIPSGLGNVVAVSAGDTSFSLALKSDGTVAAWGANNFGQLNVPAGLAGVIAIAAGESHSLALKSDGTVVAWGNNYNNACDVPAGLNGVIAIAAGGVHSMALKDDGTVVQWGNPDASLNAPAGLTNVSAIAAAAQFAVAVKADGSVVSWGGRYDQAHPAVPDGLSGVISLTAGRVHVVAQKADGSLVAWGNDIAGQASIPAGLTSIYSVTAGGASNLALVPTTGLATMTQPMNQTVAAGASVNFTVSALGAGVLRYQWYRDGLPLENGDNVAGVNTATLSLSDVTGLDEGRYYVTVSDDNGSITSVAATLSVTPTDAAPVFVSRPMSRVLIAGGNPTIAANVSNATKFQWRHQGRIIAGATSAALTLTNVNVADGGYYELGATNAGGAVVWSVFHLVVAPAATHVVAQGGNFYGQSTVPVGLAGVVAVKAGAQVSFALKADGTVVGWGFSYAGQATVLADLTNVVAVQAAPSFALALKGDGTVVSWGSPSLSTAGLSEVVAVAEGYSHYLALKADGTVVAGGTNENGQATVPAGLGRVVAIAAGGVRSMAVCADGTVVTWGGGDANLANVPASVAPVTGLGCTFYYAAAQRRDGTIRSWPNDVPAGLGPVSGFSVGYSILVVKSDQTLASVVPGSGTVTPELPGTNNVVSVSAGADHFLALIADSAPVVQTGPALQTVGLGGSAVFSVSATGQGPLTYQWRLNGVALTDGGRISGANTAILTVAGVGAEDIGEYTVAISDGTGTAIAGPGVLQLTTPVITKQPGSKVALAGATFEFSVTAQGPAPLVYQWYQGYPGDTSVPVEGAATAVLSVSNVTQARRYWVRVSNPAGQADSIAALVLPFAPRNPGAGTVFAMHSAAYVNGRYMVMGGGGGGGWVAQSVNGIDWSSNALSFDIGNRGSRMAFGSGLYVTGGGSTTNNIYTSTNGVSWNSQISMHYNSVVRGVAYDDGLFVAVSDGGISTSPDGVAWTSRATIPGTTVVRGAGRWVAGSSAGYVRTSLDGITWSPVSVPTTQTLIALAYGNGRFVALAGNSQNEIWTSLDGLSWQKAVAPQLSGTPSIPTAASENYSLSYGGGIFVGIVGPNILLSTDGVNWTVTTGMLDNSLALGGERSLTFGAGCFLYAGGAQMLQSAELPGAIVVSGILGGEVILSGTSATLTVNASGQGLTYQWYEGASGDTTHPLGGATNASLAVQPVQTTNYWVRVAGGGAEPVDSTAVTVTVAVGPAITLQPQDADVATGSSTTLSAAATGIPAPSFQWYSGSPGDTSQPVSNATSGSLTVTTPAAVARYWVRVSNSAGSADSTAAVVTPWFQPTAIQNRQLGGVAYGDGRWVVSGFSSNDYYSDDGLNWHSTANAFGGQSGGPVTYGNGVFIGIDSDQVGALWRSTDGATWRQIFVPGAGIQFGKVAYAGGLLFALGSNGQFATSLDGANWTMRSVGYSNSLYDVAYGNGIFVMAGGSNTYTSPDLGVWSQFPVVDTQTRIYGLAFGSGQFIGVGGANLGKILASTDGATWTQRFVYGSDNGVYDVTYDGVRFAVSAINHIILSRDGVNWQQAAFPNTSQIVAGGGAFLGVGWSGSWLSAPEIHSGPTITVQPVSRGVLLGQNLSLSVVAGGGALTYQWRKDNIDIPGANSASFNITNFQSTNAGRYVVVVTDANGSVMSDTAVLTAVVLPQVLTQPQSLVVNVGNAAFLEVVVAGDAPTSYAWYKDGLLLSGKTDARLTFVAAQASDTGSYYVTVTNAAGSVISAVATLNVRMPPLITRQPGSQNTIGNAPVSFSVVAASDTSIHYLWQRSAVGLGLWTVVPLVSDYSGQQTATLLVNNPTPANNGDQFRCIVTNVAGSVISQPATLMVIAATSPLAVFGGYSHTQFLRGDGTMWAMGGNYVGQLGDGTTMARLTPVPGAAAVVSAASGFDHSLFVKQDGTLWAMGDNQLGELGTNDAVNRSTPAQMATGVVAAAAGYRHSLFRKTDGTLWAVGANANGQLGDGTTTNHFQPMQVAAHVADLAAGFQHSVFVKTDGTVWATGSNSFGQFGDGTTTNRTSPVQVGANTARVATFYHTLFLRTDGTLWAAGRNDRGQLGDGTTTSRSTAFQVATNVAAIAAGAFHSVFLKTDGTVWAMGANDRGQLGDGTTTDRLTPVQVASGATGISAGLLQSFVLKADGTLWGAGQNDQGQLGDGTTTDRSTPVQIASGGQGAPGLVANPAATNSAAADRVQLTWSPVLGAVSYEVWRSAGNDSSTASRLAAGVNGAFYEDLSAVAGVSYYYWIKAANPSGAGSFAYSAVGRQGVPAVTPVSIATQPATQTINVGDLVSFTVTAGGTAPFTYQWRKGGSNLADAGRVSGSATATLTLSGAQTADAGSYDVVVTNAAGSATSSAATLTVNLLAQTNTFNAPADRAYTTVPFTLSATASSGLPVAFSVLSGPATLSGSDVTLTGVGPVTVRASQAGDATYAAAANVDRSFNVTKATATVTLGSLTATYDGTPHSATATTNPASLSVSFTYDGGAPAPTNAGSYAVVGTVSDTLYQGSASGTLAIAKANQTIAFTGPADQPFTATPLTLSATATSGLTVGFSVVAGPASINSASLTLTGSGAITVRASQGGDANYNAAPDVDRTFSVAGNFSAWQQAKFTASELLNHPELTGPNAVYGHDGLPNLVKYALGLEPKQDVTSGLPDVSTTATDWTYTYTRPTSVTDVTYEVEVSTDLTSWSTNGVTHELVTSDGTTDTWHGRYPLASAGSVFFRLKVTRP